MTIIQPTTKTYFICTTEKNKFPPEFILSRNPKYINVISCKAVYKDYMPGDIKVHASFIHRDHYDDYFCCMANNNHGYVKKFEYLSETQDFDLWFTNLNDKKITPDSFLLELLLVY